MSMKDFIDRAKAQEDQEARDKRDYPFGVPERVRRERVEAEARKQAAGAKVSDFEKKTWGPCGVLSIEDDGACCVPSPGDLVEAAFAFFDRTGKPHWCVTETIPGLEYVRSVYEIPADKRAAVIEALNKLEAA